MKAAVEDVFAGLGDEQQEQRQELKVERTESEYDTELSIQGLSAIIFGGFDLGDFEFRGWGLLDQNVINRIELLFPQVIPSLHSRF